MSIRAAVAADAQAIARVHFATWHTTYRGLMPDDILDRLDQAAYVARWRRRLDEGESGHPVFVAEADGAVVGFAHAGPERTGEFPAHTAEVMSLYILEGQQGRGLGRGLVRSAAAALAPDHRGLLIWVLENNPARGFYEAIGGAYLARKDFQLGGHTLYEVAYGWPDLRTLL